jgi:uncharacterized protein YjbI with pentapeptide repeats
MPFASLRGDDLSVKPANWNDKPDPDPKAVSGAQMNGVDLREADLTNAFLVGALLNDAHFEGAELLSADLRNAELIEAHMEGADLLGARLNGATLTGAHFAGADLTGADLTDADIKYADFGKATVGADQLLKARNYRSAYLGGKLLEALGLPPNNGDAVRVTQNKEKEEATRNPSAAELARVDRLRKMIPGGNLEAETIRSAIIIMHRDGGTQVETVPIAPAGPGLPAVAFSVAEVAKLYNFPADLDGRGQTIGIIELGGGYRESDLDAYFAKSKLPRPAVSSVVVNGAKNNPTNANSADAEVQLNVEIVGSVAPKARLVVYFAPNTNAGFLAAVKTAADDTVHHPSVILICWGGPESTWTPQSIQALDQALGSAAQAGITVVASSGENGATDGVRDDHLHVDFPASSPWVLAVGGTKLIARGGTIASEVVWNDGKGGGGSGGGVSNVFPQPQWQSGIRMPAEAGGKVGRGVPDVSGNADPTSGYKVVVDGQAVVIGGTSAAAALWAGLIALLNQGLGPNLGHVNPLLYRVAGQGVFHAITSGQNGLDSVKGFPAGPGWNAATGWGTPDGGKLLEALRGTAR